MKKQLTKEYYVSDFSERDEIAAGKVYPTLKDATADEMRAFAREIRFPKMFGGEMSGKFIALDPDWADAVVTFEVKIDKPGEKAERVEKAVEFTPMVEEIKEV